MKRRTFLQIYGLTAGALCLSPAAKWLTRAAPPEGPAQRQPFSFLVVGDTHFARPDYYQPETIGPFAKAMTEHTARSWNALWDKVQAELKAGEPRPSFILQLGDYVHGDCPSEGKSQTLLREFVEDMTARKFPVPLMLTRGNHDIYGKGMRAAYDAHMPAFLRKAAPESQGRADYSFDAGGSAHFIVLDVFGGGKGEAWLDQGQLKWLKEDLTAFRQRAPQGLLFVVAHAPLFPINPRGAVFDTDPDAHAALTALLVKHRTCAFLCGHLRMHSTLAYTDPDSKHTLTQIMTYAILPAGAARALPCKTPAYDADLIADVNYRKPADREAMRTIIKRLAPNAKGPRLASVPGFQRFTVDAEGQTRVTAYRGLSGEAYQTLELPGA
jgi:hypothetical protein